MKSFHKLLSIYIIVLLATFSSIFIYTQFTEIDFGDIEVEDAKRLIESNVSLVIVDVRTSDEFKSGHIRDSINICVTCDMSVLLRFLRPKNEILVYCRSGVRSANAKRFLNENGYSKVYNLLGGIEAWKDAGYVLVT